MYTWLIVSWILIMFFFSFFSLAPFVPTKTKDLKRISKILDLKPWERFLEIWCWTAKVSQYIAKTYPNNEITWIELSPFFYVISKMKQIFSRQKNLKIIYWNALKENFAKYDVFYIFWMDKTIENKIFPKIEEEAKWKKLISYCFSAKNENSKQVKYKKNDKELAIYEYIF